MICQWCHSVMSGALHWWFGVCRLGLRKRVGEMQWAPHNLNEGPHQAGDVCLVLSVSFTTAACDSMVRSLRRSLDSLSTACKIWSFFSSGSLCHFLAKRHVLTTLLHFFSTSLPYKYLIYILQHTLSIFPRSGKTRVRRRDSERNCPVPRRFNEKPFSHVTPEHKWRMTKLQSFLIFFGSSWIFL